MTASIAYPSPAVYARAVQVRSRFHESLQSCRTREGIMAGLPLSFTGANAIVFPVDDTNGAWALRFFTNARAADADRYTALEEFQKRVQLQAPARCRWLERAIRIGDEWFPGLHMELIDGVLLDQYVLQLAEAEDSDSLAALAKDWRQMINELQIAGFAHGDLQHGNVLVERSTGALRLVDFDGLWLEGLANNPPGERGHASYQHPERRTAADWGSNVDTFSALIIYLSVQALALDPSLRRHGVSGDRLLIAADELTAVTGPKAPVISKLVASDDSEIARLAGLLVDWLQGSPNSDKTLEQLLDHQQPAIVAESPSADPVDPSAGSAPSPGVQDWWVAAQERRRRTPDRNLTTATQSEQGRRLPSIADIRLQTEQGGPKAHSTTMGPTAIAGPRPAKPVGGHPAGHSTGHSTATAQAPGGPLRTDAETPDWAAAERVTAAAVDGALGLFLVLHLLWMAQGVVPGKQAVGLEVRRVSGDQVGLGRLLIRELLLKQVALDLGLLGVFLGQAVVIAAAFGWLAFGAIFALGPARRSIWDHICDTEVVRRGTAETTNASASSGSAGGPVPTATINETSGATWW